METPEAFAEQALFARAIGRAEIGTADDGKLLEIHDLIKGVVDLGPKFSITVHRGLANDDAPESWLRAMLLVVSLLNPSLGTVIEARRPLEVAGHDVSCFWPEELQDQLTEIKEDLEDLEETIALRLSPKFRSEVAAALAEAHAPSGNDDPAN